MANIDPRLIELIDILRDADAGWLAAEVLAGAIAGKVTTETREALLVVEQSEATRFANPIFQRSPEPTEPMSTPFTGNQQVIWAVDHVLARLHDAIAMLTSSLDDIDFVVDGSDVSDGREMTELLFRDGEFEARVTAADLNSATNAFNVFRKLLISWAKEQIPPESPTA